ncbi:MAG: tetratricopeptide repeat protein [Candidatus Promineifilaceae bacterium]
MQPTFADMLGRFVQRSLYSHGQLATLSGVPKNSITNWLGGRVKRPHRWQPLLRIAAALDLSPAETDALLLAAQQPPLAELRQTAVPADQSLLKPWPASQPAPFQAIANIPTFVGRHAELDALRHALQQRHSVALTSLRGMGGVGKTSLAAHLAYLLRPDFPDGVLWARVDTSDTMSILNQMAGAYGLDVSRYTTVDSRSAIVRGLLANKRALLVLDNAESSDQVTPLLPPSTGACAVLLTTRHDLAVTDGWTQLEVRPFAHDAQDALALFARFLPSDQVQRQEKTLREIAALVGHLPLALALVAARLARGMQLSAMHEALGREQARLDTLQRENRSVRASFDVSYAALTAQQQHFFNQLGVFGGDDFDTAAAASVAETAVAPAETLLNQLHDLSLVQAVRPGRWRLHPLLRDYARERLAAGAELETAVSLRMATHYLNLVETAAQTETDGLTASPALFVPDMSNLLAALDAGAAASPAWQVRQLRAFFDIFYQQGTLNLLMPRLQQAQQAAAAAEEMEAEATLFILIGRLLRWQNLETGGPYQQALRLALHTENPFLIVDAHKELCGWLWRVHDLPQAEKYGLAGLALAREINYDVKTSELLNNLGNVYQFQGRYDEAEACFREGVALAQQSGHLRSQVMLLQNLGCLLAVKGDYQAAKPVFAQGDRVGRQHDLLTTVMGLQGDWGFYALQAGDYPQATSSFHQSLELARRLKHSVSICVRLADLGEVARRKRVYTQAEAYLQEALTVAQDAHLATWLPLVHLRLAATALDRGDTAVAHAWHTQFRAGRHLLHAEYDVEVANLESRLTPADDNH